MAELPGLMTTQGDSGNARRRLPSRVVTEDMANLRAPSLRPTAAPVDTYARPAQPVVSGDLAALAEGLASLNPALHGYLKQQREEDKTKAPDEIARLTAGKTSADISGMVRSGQHPILNAKFAEQHVGNLQAMRQGDEDAAHLQKWYDTEFDKQKGDLDGQLREFVAKRVQEYGNNPGFAAAYMERMAGLSRSLQQRQTQAQVEQVNYTQQEATQGGVLSLARNAVDLGRPDDALLKEVNSVLSTNKALMGKSFKEQSKWLFDSVAPLAQDMEANPEKRSEYLRVAKAILQGARKGEDGVERRLTEAPDGIGAEAQATLLRIQKKHDELDGKFTASETASWKDKAHNDPANFDEKQFIAFADKHPGAISTAERESTLLAYRTATRRAERASLEYDAERKAEEAKGIQTSQDYDAFKKGDFLNPGDAQLPTKEFILSGGQQGGTKKMTADERRQGVANAFHDDLQFQKNQLVNSKKATPEQAEAWGMGQELGTYSLNGMVPDAWKDEMKVGMNQVTTAVSTGKEPPEAALKAFKRYQLVAEKAPNLLSEVTDERTKQFFDMANAARNAGYATPSDQLRAAAQYYARRDVEQERVKKSEINKAIMEMEPSIFSRMIGKAFGREAPENMGMLQDKIAKEAAMLSLGFGFSPSEAVVQAAKHTRNTYAIVNGWAVDTNDKRLPPNFEVLAEKHLENIVGILGPERFGVKSAKDLSLYSMPDGVFMVVNKRHGMPTQGEAILQGPYGNFDAKFVTPEILQLVAQNQRKQAEVRAEREGANRLQPLFVIPGTTLGVSRPNLQGYSPEEMATIEKNIDAAGQQAAEDIGRRSREISTPKLGEPPSKPPTPSPFKPFIKLRGDRK